MKEKGKLSLFTHHMIIYGKNPRASTKKLFTLVSELSKIAVNKINIKNQLHFHMLAVNNWNLNYLKYHLQ